MRIDAGRSPSGNDIGRQSILDRGDLVLERQFALLQSLDLQLIRLCGEFQRHDLGVQVTVFGPQLEQ